MIISVLIGILIVLVVGAICFWAIDKFATDSRLAKLLKLLVVLLCLGAIVQRLMLPDILANAPQLVELGLKAKAGSHRWREN